MRDNDFANLLGDDYKILHFAYPHHDEFQKKVASEVAENVAGESIKVIEGGAGSGVSTSFLLEANPNIHIVAVDSSQKMLDQAKQAFRESLNQIEIVCSDLLEFLQKQESGSADAFVAVWTIHNLTPDYREKLFPEIYRVLEPGGVFVSGDKYTVSDAALHESQLQTQLARFAEFGTITNKQIADGWIEHNLADENIKISEEEQKQILKDLGFKKAETVYRKDMEAVILGIK